MRKVLLTLWFVLWSQFAQAQEACPNGACVAKGDLKTFVQLAKDHKCRQTTQPNMQLDPIQIVVDRQGRIYGSGSQPEPYNVKINWCNYSIAAQGNTKIVAAQRVEPNYGFHFKAKAAFGFLPIQAIESKDALSGFDAGILVEPFFFHWLNINTYVGVRSFGGGIGFDILKNFGIYVGYSVSWGSWQHNILGSFYFSLW
jgi:hypothetical protein